MAFKDMATRNLTILLLFLLFLITLGVIYLPVYFNKDWVTSSFAAISAVTTIVILDCSLRRLKRIKLPKLVEFPLYENSIEVKEVDFFQSIEAKLRKKGFKILRGSDNLWCAHKNGFGSWGSVIFHIAIVICLMGFSLNFYFGFRGYTMLYEGVPTKYPEEIETEVKGRFFKFGEPYTLSLEQYQVEFEDTTPTRFYGTILFENGFNTSVEPVEVNKPAKHQGVFWRFAKWGYSTKLQITKGNEVIFNNWVNIMTNPGYSFVDRFVLEDKSEWEIELLPNCRRNQEGELYSHDPEPLNPWIKIVQLDKGKEKASQYIPLRQLAKVSEYKVGFSDYRFWQLVDVSSDPGEYVIYIGCLLMVIGLAWRLLFISKTIYFKEESEVSLHGEESTVLYWTSRAAYFNELFQEDVKRMLKDL